MRPAWRGCVAALCAATATAAVPGVSAAAPATTGEIIIGLIVPRAEGAGAPAGHEALCGSEAAVRRAGSRDMGGNPARSIRLVTAASGHPWDDAAPAIARLIHEQRASIVIGGLDAATAHLAEQVVLRERGRALFISLWASEDALTQLPVPWYFSIVPEDRRQARALAREIFEIRGARGAAVLADGSREGRSAASAFEAAAPAGRVLRFAAEDEAAVARMAALVREGSVQAVVLAAGPFESASAARALARLAPGVPIYGPLRLATPAFGRPAKGASAPVRVLWPEASDTQAVAFVREACGAARGASPTPLSLYAYDATAAAIAALAGSNRAATAPLEQRLAAVSFAGASGPVSFDPVTRARRELPSFVPVPVPLVPVTAGASAR